MQTYAIRMFNFLRFGEKNNSIVFDLTAEQKRGLKDGTTTLDKIYDEVMKNPVQHIEEAKKRGLEHLLGITGSINGNPDCNNGAGKSSLLEGMCYSRYERIVRKSATNPEKVEKAGLSVVTKIDGEYPKNMTESWVEELFETGGKIYRVKRGRSFTKTQKSSSPLLEFDCLGETNISLSSHRSGTTKEALEDVLTMDYDLFVNSQMFGQNDAGKFLTGTDKTKKEMIISLLRLQDVVLSCLEKIREDKSNSNKKVDSLKVNIEIIDKYFAEKLADINKNHPLDPSDPELLQKMEAYLAENKILSEQLVEDTNKFISNIETEIEVLSKSEEIVSIEKLKEDGRKTVADRKNKEKEMGERIAEWQNMQSSILKEITRKNEALISIKSKREKTLSSLKAIEQSISTFNLEENRATLGKCQKAKEVKESYDKSFIEINNKILQQEKEKAILDNNLSVAKADLSKIEATIRKMGSEEKYNCSECKSLVPKEHFIIKKEECLLRIKTYETEIEKINSILKDIKSQHLDINGKLTKINHFINLEQSVIFAHKQFEDNKKKVQEFTDLISDADADALRYANEKADQESQIVKYNERIADVKENYSKEINILNEKINKLMADIKEVDSKAAIVRQKIEDKKNIKSNKIKERDLTLGNIGKATKDIEFFVHQKHSLNLKKKELTEERTNLDRILLLEDVFGLDGIQTRIVKKYLPLLNVYIKEFLDVLSDGEIIVKMLINEKGKVDMAINGATAETYEMLSGGEKMIIRLSVDIGLSLLAFSRTAQKPELICLDEILSPLDNYHVEKVFNILQKLQDKFSRIIIISHKTEIKNRLKNNIIVEKNGGKDALSEIKRIE